MKNLYQYTMILLAGVLGACSSLEVSDPYAESLPSRFNAQEYAELHPVLRKLQLKDYVLARNEATKIALGEDGYEAAKAADDQNFKSSPNLGNICLFAYYRSDFVADSCALVATSESVANDLLDFNIVGVADDWTELQNAPFDEVPFIQHYVVYGQAHGWAYRKCDDVELGNPGRDPGIVEAQRVKASDSIPFRPDPGYYCVDQVNALHQVNP